MAKPCIASAYPSALHNLNPLGSVVPGAYHGLTDEQQQEGLLYVVFGAVEAGRSLLQGHPPPHSESPYMRTGDDGSVDKSLAMQVREPEFESPSTHINIRWWQSACTSSSQALGFA